MPGRKKYHEKKRHDGKGKDRLNTEHRQAIGDLMGKWVAYREKAYRQQDHKTVVVMTYPLSLMNKGSVEQAKAAFEKSGRVLICVPYRGDGRPEFRVIE